MSFSYIKSSLKQLGNFRIVIVATADADGTPHIAVARGIDTYKTYGVSITEWFCPTTVVNAEVGRKVSVAIWNPDADVGIQLIGLVAEAHAMDVMDANSPIIENIKPEAQLLRRLCIDVEKVLKFSLAYHTDEEEV